MKFNADLAFSLLSTTSTVISIGGDSVALDGNFTSCSSAGRIMSSCLVASLISSGVALANFFLMRSTISGSAFWVESNAVVVDSVGSTTFCSS